MEEEEAGTQTAIRQSLREFARVPLHEGALNLLAAMDINGRTLETTNGSLQHFLQFFPPNKALTQRETDLLNANIYQIFFLCQWTGEEISEAAAAGAGENIKFDHRDSFIQSLLFVTASLRFGALDASLLGEITRAINKIFAHPVIVFFREGRNMALGTMNRRAHQRDHDKAVLEEPHVNRNIRLDNPEYAHLKILHDLVPQQLEKLIENDEELEISRDELSFDHLAKGIVKTLDDDEEKIARRVSDTIDFSNYLRDAARFPLLSREEEVELGKQVENGCEDSKNKFINSNLRLVIWWAKKYSSYNNHLLLPDLVQEGNLGLIRGVEKWDWQRGFKFSTYGSWWIRQSITRAISNKERMIRVPVYMLELINKIKRAQRVFYNETGRGPTLEEIAQKTELSLEQVKKAWEVIPDALLGDNIIMDARNNETAKNPEEQAIQSNLQAIVSKVLSTTLPPRMERVLRMRFGIGTDQNHTLEEVGQEFSVTRERIRQIEVKALKKLRHPSRARKLKSFINRGPKIR